MNVELFSWNTTTHKDHLEDSLPKRRLLSGLIGMWSSMKISLVVTVRSNTTKPIIVIFKELQLVKNRLQVVEM